MLRVLITDDDETLIGMYRSVMRSASDVAVTYARGEAEARAALSAGAFDLAFFDLNLGERGCEGLSLLTRCRELLPRTPAFMMSTMSDAVTLERCRAARGFIAKGPSFLGAFRACVKAALTEARAHAAA